MNLSVVSGLTSIRRRALPLRVLSRRQNAFLYSGVKFDRDKEVSTNFYSAVTIAGDKLKKLESRIEKVVKRKHRTGKKRYCRCKTACR